MRRAPVRRPAASPVALIFDPEADRNLSTAIRLTKPLPTPDPNRPTPAGWSRSVAAAVQVAA